MVHGGMTVVKYLLFLFNFIFWLTGIGLIVGGTVIQIRYSAYINIMGSSFLSTPILLIVIGCIIAIVGFFGCCGAIRESYCMTMTFGVLLGVIFILELAAGIACYVLRQEVLTHLNTEVMKGMKLYEVKESHGVTQTWDKMQSEMECCGINGYTDWNVSAVMGSNHVPESCCRERMNGCGKNRQRATLDEAIEANKIYTVGCMEELKNWAIHNVAIVGGVGCGVAVIQILGICFACCLSKSILKDYEEGFYY